MNYKVYLLIFLVTSLCTTSYAQTTIIKNVNVINVERGDVKTNQHVLLSNRIIEKISSKQINLKGDIKIIDGSKKFLIPGLIDSHIHFFQSGSLYTRPDAIDLTNQVSYEEEREFANSIIPKNFKRYLRLGITTIIDLGGPFSNFYIRDSLSNDNIAPNVFVTGPLFSPYQPEEFSKLDDVPIAKIRTKEEATELFNKMLPYKPDFIKIWGVSTKDFPAEKNYPIVEHIAKLTHDKGLKLTVHATNLKTAKLAVKAGADILVHSVNDTIIDDEFISMVKKNKVAYIPTLIVSKNYVKSFFGVPDNHPIELEFGDPLVYRSLTDVHKYKEEDLPSFIKDYKENREAVFDYYESMDTIMFVNLKKLIDNDISVVTGTDAGNIGTLHATSYYQELEKMEKAGLSNFELLQASTINAAKAFGLQNSLGSIALGKKADVVLLNENPLDNINALTKIEKVFKDGVDLDLEQLLKEDPEEIVQRQVNAYNAKNIEVFLNTYSDDVKIYNFPEVLSIEGKENMRERYSAMFDRVQNLYCEIKNRIVLGNKVIDHEHVHFGDEYSDVIAIYEVENGKIAKVTFLR